MENPSHSEATALGAPTAPPAKRQPVDVFLCHNARDKPLVRQVVEGLDPEFGVPHLLDMYAISTGEAFLLAVDRERTNHIERLCDLPECERLGRDPLQGGRAGA